MPGAKHTHSSRPILTEPFDYTNLAVLSSEWMRECEFPALEYGKGGFGKNTFSSTIKLSQY